MKSKKIIFLSLALVALSVLFTGCDNDERSGYLNFNTYDSSLAPRTDRDGRFSLFFDLDIRDVRGYSSYDYLSAIQMFDSYLSFETYDNYRDRVYTTLWLSADGVGEVKLDINMDVPGKIYIDTRDHNYARFMRDVFREMEHYGKVRLYIDGAMTRYNGGPFQYQDFDIESESRLRLLFNNRY